MDPASPETPLPDLESEGTDRAETPVLLVEDTPFTRNITKRILEKAGCTVDLATDGVEAILQVENRRPGLYGMVLMDLNMPRMDGRTAARKIRHLSPETPVIGMSAGASAEDRRRCINAGMKDLLEKPVSWADVLAAIAGWDDASGKQGRPANAGRTTGTRDFENLPGIDADDALSRMDGDAAAFAGALRDFYSYAEGLDAAVKSALAQGDHDEAARLAHGLSGAAAAVSAHALAGTAKALEAALKANKPERANELAGTLSSLLQSVRKGIDEWSGGDGKRHYGDPRPDPPDGSIDQLLDRLDRLLGTNDMDAAACFAAISDYFPNSSFSAGLEELEKSIDRLDFGEARRRLQLLRTSIAREKL